MGYGWMMGLGQALGDIGKNQIPNYMDRRRQDTLDKRKVEQDAIDNTLKSRTMANDDARIQIARDSLTDESKFRDRTFGLNERDSFLRSEVPLMTGRKIAGSPFAAKLDGYGLGSMVGADGVLSPGFDDQIKKRLADANEHQSNASAAYSNANAASIGEYRQALARNRNQQDYDLQESPGSKALYAAMGREISEAESGLGVGPKKTREEIAAAYAPMIEAEERKTLLHMIKMRRLTDPAGAAKLEQFYADQLSVQAPPPKVPGVAAAAPAAPGGARDYSKYK